ncbi:hypothetical protein CC80DRAFT_362770, partial [Byssothecium circinans]
TSPLVTPTPNPSCTTQKFSDFPTRDIACAVGGTSGFPPNYRDTLKSCCKSAPVQEWAAGCALYCLSVDQTIDELQKCWQKGGVLPGEIYCSGNMTATATGRPAASASTGAGGAQATGSGGGSGNGVGVRRVSKVGLGVVGMVVVSAVLGVVV